MHLLVIHDYDMPAAHRQIPRTFNYMHAISGFTDENGLKYKYQHTKGELSCLHGHWSFF